MSKEIINRVANSKLETIDLESFIVTNERITFDLKNWLKNDLVLIEKDFREKVKKNNITKIKKPKKFKTLDIYFPPSLTRSTMAPFSSSACFTFSIY